MGASLRERLHMMYLGCGSDTTVFLTHLTERVRLYVSVPDSLPCSPVSFGCVRVTLISVVVGITLTLVSLAVSAIGQLRTAGVTAWSPWTLRQFCHLAFARQRASGTLCSKGSLLLFIFHQYNHIILTSIFQRNNYISYPIWRT